MFELLLVLIYVVGMLGFLAPLMAIWFAIDQVHMDKCGWFGVLLGFVIAFVVSGVLYLSVATISHNSVEFYSHYGSDFSRFYGDLLFKTALFANVILMLLWFDKSFISNRNFSWSLLMGYQVSLFLLLVFNPLLVMVLEKVGLIDLSIDYFAKNLGILSDDVDIRRDLIHPKLSTSSYIQMGAFFFCNQILVVLMAIRHRRTTKRNQQSD